MIKIENVTKTYKKDEKVVRAISDISITASKGEFVIVKGSSGCGKTTLLLTIGGLLHPQAGKVIINNQDIYELTPGEMANFRAKNIGFVFQQYHLIPYLTILENVTVPSLAHSENSSTERAKELLAELGLKDRIHHTPAELSAGEKQRTALARALLYKPLVILADEITGNLDHKNASIVLNKLTDYTKNGGTVLLVTHDENALEYADRTIHMEN